MLDGDLKENIYNFLKRGAVSFAEIERGYGKGSCAYGCKEHIYYWFSLTEPVVDAIHELYREKQILFYPANILVYLVDGLVPRVPIAKGNRSYKTDRWLPVVIWRTDAARGVLSREAKKVFREAGWDV